MTTLVLTVVGADRAGLVAAVSEVVGAHGGNWENSRLAELAGTFAGVIQVAVADDRADELREALSQLDELLTVTVHAGSPERVDAAPARHLTFHVLGNDHPGIVRDISSALSSHGVSIGSITTETRDAAMFGGKLFEASVDAVVPDGVDLDDVTGELERIAAEIQVDVSLS